MENPKLEIPESAVLMVSPIDYRLSSLTGYCMIFRKNVPVRVPPIIYEEAYRMGIRMVEGEEMPDVPPDKEALKGAEEANRLAAEAKATALRDALTIIITRNLPEDFRADGTPKTNKVIAEMSPEISRPTATEVADMYATLQENLDLAED